MKEWELKILKLFLEGCIGQILGKKKKILLYDKFYVYTTISIYLSVNLSTYLYFFCVYALGAILSFKKSANYLKQLPY